MLAKFKEYFVRRDDLARRRQTHSVQIGAWQIDMGPIEPDTGLSGILFAHSAYIRIQEGSHSKAMRLHNNDLTTISRTRDLVKQFALLKGSYLETTDPARAFRVFSDMEQVHEELASLGVHLPAWAKKTR